MNWSQVSSKATLSPLNAMEEIMTCDENSISSTPETDQTIKLNILVNSFMMRKRNNKHMFTVRQPLIEQREIEGVNLNDLVSKALRRYKLDP